MVNEFYEPVECSVLEPDGKEQKVSRAVFEQVMWERDIALKQLAEIGKGLGEKMDDVATVVHGKFVQDGPRFRGGVDFWHCSNCEKKGGIFMGLFCRHDMQFVGRSNLTCMSNLFRCSKCGKYFEHSKVTDSWKRRKYIDVTEWIFKEERMNEK